MSNAEMVIHAVVARSLVKSSNGAPLGTVGLHNFTRRTLPDERIPSIASQRSAPIPMASSTMMVMRSP